MRIIIVGRRETGKTYLIKEFIKDMQIKNIVWVSYKEREFPKLNDYENLKNIKFIDDINYFDYNINVHDDTVYVFDDVIYDHLQRKVLEFSKKTNNIIISMSYPMSAVKDYINLFDKVCCFKEQAHLNIMGLKRWFEKNIDCRELLFLQRYKYKEYIPMELCNDAVNIINDATDATDATGIELCDICGRECDGVHRVKKLNDEEKLIQDTVKVLLSYNENTIAEIVKRVYEIKKPDIVHSTNDK